MKCPYSLLFALLAAPAFAAAQEPPERELLVRLKDVTRVEGEIQAAKAMAAAEIAHARTVSLPLERAPQQRWYQEDPADSLFRAAHGLFTKQEYRQAAERFANVRARFPNTRYFCDAAYFEAFSRYRLGTPDDLRTGYRVLSGLDNRCASASRRADVPELLARINSALARLGDREAAERMRRAANQGQNVCDREERNVKIEALNALAQMDPQAANPVLRSVLATKDACSAPVRRQAISLVARRNDPESVALLGSVALNDANRDNQLEAVRALGRMSTDAAFAEIDQFLRNSRDDRVQGAAVAIMTKMENPRAHAAVRGLIDRKDVSEEVRIAAITALASRQDLTADYWRSLYRNVESDKLRTAVIAGFAKNRPEDASSFLLSLARNPAEPYEVRRAAVSRIRGTAPVADLYALLQTADSRSLRMLIVRGLSERKEPAATDRLIDIAKTSTDPEVRNAAIRALGQSPRKDDPKVVRALSDILACC